jgi:hypothetical protein
MPKADRPAKLIPGYFSAWDSRNHSTTELRRLAGSNGPSMSLDWQLKPELTNLHPKSVRLPNQQRKTRDVPLKFR